MATNYILVSCSVGMQSQIVMRGAFMIDTETQKWNFNIDLQS